MPLQTRPDGLKFDPENGVIYAPRERIIPDPGQPRKSFPKEQLNALRRTIDNVRDSGGGLGKTGLDMPLVCRWEVGSLDKNGNPTKTSKLILKDGERRYRATDASFPLLPLVIKNDTSEESWDVALRSSFQKELLTPLEAGNALAAKMQSEGWGINKTARYFGVSEGFVKNRVYLRDCPADVQDMVNQHPDTMSHALAFRAAGSKLPADDRKELIQEVKTGMSVPELKQEIESRITLAERKRDTRRAPDTHTQQRITQAASTGTAPVSRGERVTGAPARESVAEAVNSLKLAAININNAASWFRTIKPSDYQQKVIPEIEKLIAELERYRR